MSPRRKPPAPDQDLQTELIRAYETLGQITSRLMLVNEAVEASLSSHERVEVAERFLQVTARGVEIARAAIFLVEGETFSVGATYGLGDEEIAQLPASDADVEACGEAVDSGKAYVVDGDLVTGDALEVVERGLYGEPGPEEEEELGEDSGEEGEEAPDAGDGTERAPAEGEAEDEGAAPAGEAEIGEDEEADPGESEAGAAPTFGIYLPVRIEDEAIAILALGERTAGRTYTGEDLLFLSHLLRQFAVSIQRATLLERNAERLRETEALLRVSREITSTLDLDAVLRAVVNTAGAVVENDRAEIALLKGGRLVLSAISGATRVDADQTELFKLERPFEFLRLQPARMQIGMAVLESDDGRPGAAVFLEYFTSQDMRSFMALPLKDDQGLMGFLCLESRKESWDLEPGEGDALDILAAQTTMALRNAMLYSQLPLRGVAAPMARLRFRLGVMDPRTRRRWLAAAAALVLVLLLPIFPERAGGPVEVTPLHVQGARSPLDGVVTRVLVRGGESVRAGQTLAVVEDLELSGRLASLAAEAEASRSDVAAARQSGDFAAWRTGQIRLSALEGTLAFEERRAGGGRLAAPFDGQVLELDLARRVGQHLGQGEAFCTVARLDTVGADLFVSEERIGRVSLGQSVSVKVVSYPTRTFRGRVTEMGWEAEPDAKGTSRFLVRAVVANPGTMLRPGMTGAGRAVVGWRPLVLALFEPLARAAQLSWW
jgi:GAF domain-containing protein